MLVQPLGEAPQLCDLALVHLPVAFRVVPDEHLARSRGRTPRSSRRTARRTRSRTRSGPTSRPASRACSRPPSPRVRRSAPYCASTRTPANSFGAPCSTARWNPSQISVFAPGTQLDVADHLLERPSMVEREHVETFVVAELVQSDGAHQYSLPVKCVSLLSLCRASIRRTVPERERMTIESVIAPSFT